MYQLEAHQTIRVDIIRFEFSDNDIDCSRQHTASQRHCSSQIRPQTTPLHNASNGVQSRRVNKIWLFSLHTAREWQRERERESEREAHQPNNNVRINNVWQLQTKLLQLLAQRQRVDRATFVNALSTTHGSTDAPSIPTTTNHPSEPQQLYYSTTIAISDAILWKISHCQLFFFFFFSKKNLKKLFF